MSMAIRRANYTGATTVAVSMAAAEPLAVDSVRVHLSAAGGAGNLTIGIDSILGAEYDCVFSTTDMTSVTDLVYVPTRPLLLVNGDALTVAWANGSSRTYGIEVIYSAI